MTKPWPGRPPVVATLALVAVLLGACQAGPATTTAASPASTTAPGEPTPTPTATPRGTSADGRSIEPGDSLEAPPEATLVAGGGRHAGEAGSWFWAGGANDAPWLPAAALERAEIPAGRVTVELDGDVEVESWSARAAAAEDAQGVELTRLGDGSGEASFDSPEPGAWVVAVDVRFADGRGSATYYWYVVVT